MLEDCGAVQVANRAESVVNPVTSFDIDFGLSGNLSALDRTLPVVRKFDGLTGAYLREMVS